MPCEPTQRSELCGSANAEESDRANSAQILSCEFHTAREVLDKFFGAKNSRMASSSAEYDAFLTHDWGDDELGRSNHARVAEVNRLLKAAGFVTWFDEDGTAATSRGTSARRARPSSSSARDSRRPSRPTPKRLPNF